MTAPPAQRCQECGWSKGQHTRGNVTGHPFVAPPTETPDEAAVLRENLANIEAYKMGFEHGSAQKTYRAGTAESERLREAAKSFRQETAAMLEALEPGEVPAAVGLRYMKAREDLDAALDQTKEKDLTP